MIVRFWGVRGSIPVPGKETIKYGGNTTCLEVFTSEGNLIIIDAGTGIRVLGQQLMKEDFGQGKGVAHILFTHSHWDHIQGFPFFAPIFIGKRNKDGKPIEIGVKHNDVKCLDYYAGDYEIKPELTGEPDWFTLRRGGRWIMRGHLKKDGVRLAIGYHHHYIDPSF